MAPHSYKRVRVTATNETGMLVSYRGSANFHIETRTDNYVKCQLVEMDSTGEIRAYRESALKVLDDEEPL